MIFASRALEDPEPWAYHQSSKTGPGPFGTPDRSATRIDKAMLYFPRAEYIPKTTHPANPILVAFREDDDPDIEWWLTDNLDSWGDLWAPEQIDHARRVLTRLVQWGKVES